MKKADLLSGVAALVAAATATWAAAAQQPSLSGARVQAERAPGETITRVILAPRGLGIAQSDRPGLVPPKIEKKRLFVLSDMEADADDSQTLVRLMLYANDIDIEGLTATTSTHQRSFVAPQSIRKVVQAYGKVQPNLLNHAPGYLPAQHYLDMISEGPAVFGMKGVGDGHDSSGSEALIKALQKPDPRPLWVSVWGGPNVLAQALFKIRKTMPAAEAARLYAKLRVYTISDQDDSGPWIRRNFPTIFYIVSPAGYGSSTWGGMGGAGPGSDQSLVSNEWLAKNIQQGHGPLGLEYPDIAYGMEGDTPSWLGLVPNGLNDMEHPDWGGWGGRYELKIPTPVPGSGNNAGVAGPPESRPIWTNASDTWPLPPWRIGPGAAAPASPPENTNNRATIYRWRSEYQNDFAGRMLWTTKPYAEANHNPVAMINGPDRFTVRSGEYFSLDADGSWDPDGDSISFLWFQYTEIGNVFVPSGTSPYLYNRHSMLAPDVTSPQTAHFVVKVTDKGTPAMSSYRRVIVTIIPK